MAFRHFLPEQEKIGEFRLTSERSWFHFVKNHTVWAANYGGFVSHQEDERTLELPLDFLGRGKYEAHIWTDAHEANDFPNRIREEKHIVTAKDTLSVRMASGDGYVVHIAARK